MEPCDRCASRISFLRLNPIRVLQWWILASVTITLGTMVQKLLHCSAGWACKQIAGGHAQVAPPTELICYSRGGLGQNRTRNGLSQGWGWISVAAADTKILSSFLTLILHRSKEIHWKPGSQQGGNTDFYLTLLGHPTYIVTHSPSVTLFAMGRWG